jgi:hypothetical protein
VTQVAVRRGHRLTRFRFLRALRAVRRQCPPGHSAVIGFTVGEARHLLDHGEGGLGLEILLSNLHEVSFPAPPALVAELRWLAARLAIAPSYASLLDQIHA